jgi:hypothetical protein
MRYDAQTHTLHLERKDCSCGDGTQSRRIDCPGCKGTGKGPRGGRNGCRKCYGSGNAWDHDNRVPCTRCNGDYINHDPENWCDKAPAGLVQSLPWAVVRQDRSQSFAEAYLGTGLFSCTDYGTAWDANDDAALIATLKSEERHTQAIKICRKTDDPLVYLVATGIVVILTPNGYSPVAYFDDMDAVCAEASAHLPADVAMMIGTRYHAMTGGNGTALAGAL